MTFYWFILTLALSLAADREANAAQIPTFAQYEWRMACQSYPHLRDEPEKTEALLTQMAESEIIVSRDPSLQPLAQRQALGRAGDAYHWLGHYLESIEAPTRTDPHLRIQAPDHPIGDLNRCSDSEPC
jgi:hypothetical protein